VINVVTTADVRAAVGAARSAGRRIGFVPTMGYLHEGHLALFDRAREHTDFLVASIFVNPLQFGPSEDLARYPRDLDRDSRLAEERSVDILFIPAAAEMYPDADARIRITPGAMGDVMCGAFRPGHFSGVLTVVGKLFNIVAPDVAVFGQKDYQQAALIRRMVHDLDFPVRIDVAPTVREADGLALSSRNTYLDESARRQAASIYSGLQAARTAFGAGERGPAQLCDIVRTRLDTQPDIRVQYIELVDSGTLQPPVIANVGNVLAVAAFVGATRLIDNVIL
jgi:pantoate--beta-alanine ligase